MENVYLGRQPIFDDKGQLFAYEILYRDKDKQSNMINDRFTSASVISSILNKFGTRSLLGDRMAFVKIDEKFLMNDIIFLAPKEFFIFSLIESIEINEKILERVHQLFTKGYKLCINDTVLTQETFMKYSPILKELSFFKVNFHKEIDEDIEDLIEKLKAHKIQVVGTGIDDSIYYDNAKMYGCDFFQGYFLAKPKIVANPKYDSSQLNIMKLYNLLMQDTNIDEITKEFENNHSITVQLLQFINSGAFHFRNKISSIHHVLMLVGRIPLGQWLMLMVYSKSMSKNGGHSPLMLMAKNRTELMQKLLKTIEPNAKSNALGEAYFVGVLSLQDAVFGVELKEILEKMHISDDIKNALLKHEGLLGELYALVEDIEAFNTRAIRVFAMKYDLDHMIINQLIIESIESVNSFEDSLSA